MKKLFVLMCAAAALSVSCTKENQIESASSKEVTLTAYSGESTKTSLVSNGDKMSVNWSPDDEISLFFISGENGGNRFVTANSGSVATFTGTISAFSGNLDAYEGNTYFWGVFPYNENASCDGTSVTTSLATDQWVYSQNVNPDLLVTVGRSQSLSMYFQNTLAVVQLTVASDDITSVTFSGNNDEYVAGEYKVSFNAEGKVVNTPTENATRRVTVIPIETEVFTPNVTYFFAFIPSTFSKGYTLKFTKTDGSVGVYSTSSAIEFNKAFYTMTCKDNGLDFGYPTVDLGLSVKWAPCNLGAYNPEDTGLYYQWGSLVGYGSYVPDGHVFNWSTYPWAGGAYNTLTKYNYDESYGDVDALYSLEDADDAAYKTSEGKWHMPTSDNWNELRNNCTWTWTTLNGVKGYKVQSNKEGYTDKWIFLPVTGYRYNDVHNRLETDGMYWSRNISESYPTSALYFTMTSNARAIGNLGRVDGLPIRPVSQ